MIHLNSGTYRHHLGGLYTVICCAVDSTNSRVGVPVVVYVSLSTGQVRVRDQSEFTEIVEWPDGFRRARFIREDIE